MHGGVLAMLQPHAWHEWPAHPEFVGKPSLQMPWMPVNDLHVSGIYNLLQPYKSPCERAIFQRFSVVPSVSHKARWGARVCCSTSAIHMVEMQSPPQKQHCIGPLPNLTEKHFCFSSSKNQCDAVAVIGQPG